MKPEQRFGHGVPWPYMRYRPCRGFRACKTPLFRALLPPKTHTQDAKLMRTARIAFWARKIMSYVEDTLQDRKTIIFCMRFCDPCQHKTSESMLNLELSPPVWRNARYRLNPPLHWRMAFPVLVGGLSGALRAYVESRGDIFLFIT